MRKFLANRKGNMAIMFAVSAMPILGAAGVAIDYTRVSNVRSFMQAQSDMAALSGAQLGPTGNPKVYLDHIKFFTEQRFGGDGWVAAMNVEGKWLSTVDYRVTVKGDVPVTLLGGLPGFPDDVAVSVVSTVRMAEPRLVYKPPTVNELDNEAGDYNRVSVYCYDETKKKEANKGRTQMTPISDNGGTKYVYTMPRCNAGEMLSYKLTNVRLVRDQPSKWETATPRFDYYTDTVPDINNAEKYAISCKGNSVCNNPPSQGWSILETVLCKSANECKPKSQGGIIPEGKNRTPQRATKGCAPGQYMYYGWEDRPPGLPGQSEAGDDWTKLAWTDRDYDDIRIVIGCPDLEEVEDRLVRLID